MNPKLPESEYSLGELEAWSREERVHLEQNFLEIDQFDQISDAGRVFLCGRRGTGKSAIALMLTAKNGYSYRLAVPGERQHYGRYIRIVEELKRLKIDNENVDIRSCIHQLWTWAVQVKAMQVLLCAIEDEDKIKADKWLRIIDSYFQTLPKPLSHKSEMGPMLTKVFHLGVKILKESGIAAFEDYLADLTETNEFHAAKEALQRYLTTEHKTILLVFDTLESYKIFQEYMIESFQGIIDSLVSLWLDSKMDNIFVKLFLPAEVFSEIFDKYPGKIFARAVFLRWRSADLISMIGRRFLNILEKTSKLSPNNLALCRKLVETAYEKNDGRELRRDFWYKMGFLPATIKNRLGYGEDCFAYMFRHTQRRPRDILALMQSVVNYAVKANEFPFISEESVRKGVHNKQLLLRIVAESLTPYEGELPVSLRDASQGVFFRRPSVMSGRDIRQFARGIYSLAPVADIDPGDFLHVLADCGVIGLVDKEQKSTCYTKARFSYIYHGNILVEDRFQYCVHPAVADLFEMDNPPDGRAIYPFPETLEDKWLEAEVGIE